jgi:hypothetical protein
MPLGFILVLLFACVSSRGMTRSPPPRPTKAELGEMTVAELSAYIRELQSELEWARGFRQAMAPFTPMPQKVRSRVLAVSE